MAQSEMNIYVLYLQFKEKGLGAFSSSRAERPASDRWVVSELSVWEKKEQVPRSRGGKREGLNGEQCTGILAGCPREDQSELIFN